MKRYMFSLIPLWILTIAALCFSFAGCATAPGAPPLTPAQIISQVCPPAQTTIITLQAMGTSLPANIQEKLTKYDPIVNAFCNGAGTVDMTSVKNFAKTAIPEILTLVQSSDMSQDRKDKISAALLITQVAVASL